MTGRVFQSVYTIPADALDDQGNPIPFYRVYDYLTTSGVVVAHERFTAISKTPKGYWIVSGHVGGSGSDMTISKLPGMKPKWVSNTSTVKYAHRTIEKAIESFMCRKRRQILLTTHTLERAKTALESAQRLKERGAEELLVRSTGAIAYAGQSYYSWDDG